MAILLNENIGQNYKGILNLGNTVNSNLTGTLQAVTDGDGNASPLQLSTSQTSNVFTGSHTILWRANATLTDYSGWHQADGNFVILKKDNSPLWFNIDSAVNFSSGFGSTGRSSINAAGNWTIGGGFTNLARLHVRGDGTNPIARFENSSGTMLFGVASDLNLQLGAGNVTFGATSDSSAYSSNGNGFLFRSNVTVSPGLHAFTIRNINTISATSSTLGGILLDMGTFAAAAGSANFRPLNIAYTINNSGAQTGTATGIFLNATETALNSMTHNLIDLQRGGVSQFLVDRAGALTTAGNINGQVIRSNSASTFSFNAADTGMFYFNSRGGLRAPSNGVLTLLNTAETDFGRLQFGGTTSSFPALKRNAAALEVRLADDSGFATLQASQFTSNLLVGTTSGRMDIRGQYDISIAGGFTGGLGGVAISQGSSATPAATAILDVSSTTKGFLPPRMTTAQKTAITSPAKGLVVYDTDTDKLCVYNGAWTDLH